MTDTAPITTFNRKSPSASAELVERKRQAHIGRLQEQTFLLEAALEAAYDEIERLTGQVAVLEAQLPQKEEPTA